MVVCGEPQDSCQTDVDLPKPGTNLNPSAFFLTKLNSIRLWAILWDVIPVVRPALNLSKRRSSPATRMWTANSHEVPRPGRQWNQNAYPCRMYRG